MLAVLGLLAEWDGPEGAADMMSAVGARRASELDCSDSGCVERAAAVLSGLGAEVAIEGGAEPTLVVSGCPLAARVADHPELCDWMAALVLGAADVPAVSRCDRAGGRPRCRFTLSLPPALGAP